MLDIGINFGPLRQFRRVIDRLNSPQFGPITEFQPSDTPRYDWTFRNKRMLWNDVTTDRLLECSPFGKVGDRLWVKETFSFIWTDRERDWHTVYKADGVPAYLPKGEVIEWSPSTNMPREKSRMVQEIEGVRVDRLQNITEQEARCSGIWFYEIDLAYRAQEIFSNDYCRMTRHTSPDSTCATSRAIFATMWNRTNGKKPGCSWNDNPLVWVNDMRRVESRGTVQP